MSFMDAAPDNPSGRTAVLLHGTNFCGAAWEVTAQGLLSVGYRVLIPDQFGFCKSSKLPEVQYTFAMMADFTRRLMDSRQIGDAINIGHSTGGMLAMHFAVMYPDKVSRLVLINPPRLTDRAAEGFDYVPLYELIEQERAKDRASIR